MSTILLSATLPLALCAHGASQPADSRIVSVGLFKNGLAVVTQRVSIPQTGEYHIAAFPQPAHGTLWIESDAVVDLRSAVREVEVPADVAGDTDLQENLAGKTVTVHFRDGGIPPVAGRVAALAPARGPRRWSRDYRPRPYWNPSPAGYDAPRRFLIIDHDAGREYVDTAMIAHLSVEGAVRTIRRRQPVILLTVQDLPEGPATVLIRYLARGLSWAPSYRVELLNDGTLALSQKAVIRNELADLEDAEVSLISGFPHVEFGHVTSPLSPGTSWARFFQELNQRWPEGHAIEGNALTQQRAVALQPGSWEVPGLAAPRPGDGVDLHYQPVGRRSLAEGQAMVLQVASEQAPFERVVEWTLPDIRDVNGRAMSEYERRQNPADYDDSAWDALRFRNPLPFPMTTGPAMIVEGQRFHGQHTSTWVSPGQRTTLHITKALSVRTHAIELEDPGEREVIYVGRNDYRRANVRGQLTLANDRATNVTAVVRRKFSGELLEADGSPQARLLEEGAYSVNRRNELTWELTLGPGEELTLTYRYSVLVDH